VNNTSITSATMYSSVAYLMGSKCGWSRHSLINVVYHRTQLTRDVLNTKYNSSKHPNLQGLSNGIFLLTMFALRDERDYTVQYFFNA